MRCGKWIARAHLHFLKLSRQKRNWVPSSRYRRAAQRPFQELCHRLGSTHTALPLDLSDAEAVHQAAAQLQQAWPRLDSVVYMAAVYKPGTLASMDLTVAQPTVDINLCGALHTIHAVLPLLTAQKEGLGVPSISTKRRLTN